MPLAIILGIIGIFKINKSKGQLKGISLSIGVIVITLAWAADIVLVVLPRVRSPSYIMLCGTNMSALGKAMLIYANEYNKEYPTADKWCDLLLEYTDVSEKQFVCEGALVRGDRGPCHYAINPNTEPNSPPDMVLLFETKGGWNQFGGPELLTTTNHEYGNCCVLFNDGHVEFMNESQRIAELKWKVEENESGGKSFFK